LLYPWEEEAAALAIGIDMAEVIAWLAATVVIPMTLCAETQVARVSPTTIESMLES